MAEKDIKKFDKKCASKVLTDIERYDIAVNRNLNAPVYDALIVKQFQDMRDEMIEFLLDYLVEISSKDLLKKYVQNLDVPAAA